MVKNVTKDYFNKNVYDLTKVDENGELRYDTLELKEKE